MWFRRQKMVFFSTGRASEGWMIKIILFLVIKTVSWGQSTSEGPVNPSECELYEAYWIWTVPHTPAASCLSAPGAVRTETGGHKPPLDILKGRWHKGDTEFRLFHIILESQRAGKIVKSLYCLKVKISKIAKSTASFAPHSESSRWFAKAAINVTLLTGWAAAGQTY